MAENLGFGDRWFLQNLGFSFRYHNNTSRPHVLLDMLCQGS